MADLQFIITVQDDGTAVVQRFGTSVEKQAKRSTLAVNRISAGFLRFRGIVNRLPRSIFNLRNAIIGLGAAAVIRNVVQSFAEFESQMNRVRALTGATGEDFQRLTDQARELGRTTVFTASEAADAMGFLAQAGFETEEIFKALPGTLELAAAAQVDLAQSADIVTNVLTGLQLPIEDLARANDVLVTTMTSTNTNLIQLGEAFKFVGPVVTSAGINFEEAAAALGLLGNAGIQGTLAGTSLRGAIVRLLIPSKEAAATIKRLGLNVKDTQGDLVPLNQIIDQLAESGAKTADIFQIFGQRAGPGVATLVAQGGQALRDLTKELRESGGAAAEIARIQLEGLRGALKLMTSAVTDAKIEIGGALAPTIRNVAEAITRFSNAVTPAIEAITEINEKMRETSETGFDGFFESLIPTTQGLIDVWFNFQKVIISLQLAFNKVLEFVFAFVIGANKVAASVASAFIKSSAFILKAFKAIETVIAAVLAGIIRDMASLIDRFQEAASRLARFSDTAKDAVRILGVSSASLRGLAGNLENAAADTSTLEKITQDQADVQEFFNGRIRDTNAALISVRNSNKDLAKEMAVVQSKQSQATIIARELTAAQKAQGDQAVDTVTKLQKAISAPPPAAQQLSLIDQLLPPETTEARIERVSGLLQKLNADVATSIVQQAARANQALDQQLTAVEESVKKENALQQGKAQLADALFGPGGLVNNLMQSGSEEAFRVAQALQLGQAVVGASLAVIQALASPFPLNLILPPIVAANAAFQIQKILSARPGGGGGGGGGVSLGGIGGAAAGTSAMQQKAEPEARGGPAVNIIVQGFIGNEQKLASELAPLIRQARGDGVNLMTS